VIGKKLSPVLIEIESTLWEFEFNSGAKPEYTDEALRAATKIFASVLMDKMYNLQTEEKIELEDKMKMAEKVGNDIRHLVKVYTNIDTHDLYK
jgi:hypothetical protein